MSDFEEKVYTSFFLEKKPRGLATTRKSYRIFSSLRKTEEKINKLRK